MIFELTFGKFKQLFHQHEISECDCAHFWRPLSIKSSQSDYIYLDLTSLSRQFNTTESNEWLRGCIQRTSFLWEEAFFEREWMYYVDEREGSSGKTQASTLKAKHWSILNISLNSATQKSTYMALTKNCIVNEKPMNKPLPWGYKHPLVVFPHWFSLYNQRSVNAWQEPSICQAPQTSTFMKT